MKSQKQIAVNFIIFQLGWFSCVLMAARGLPETGIIIALLLVGVQLFLAENRQNLLILLFVITLIGSAWDSVLTSLNYLDGMAALLWLLGMFFETVSDYQLNQFKKNPENKGKILTQGLWKYSRHPNYFGECLVWWGFFVFALSDHAYLTIISPLLMTFLLLKFSGVSLLEETMKTRPGYENYMQHTNAFIPGSGYRKGEL